jgi:predicted RNA polymerase sigma factor
MLVLAPDHAETEGALALLLVTQARAGGRVSGAGETLPPDAQDRALWDGAMLVEGVALLDRAVARRAPGPFQVKAAIAALHAEPGPPDWPQITALLARLMTMEPTPVVALNHAVALAETGALAQALTLVEGLAERLSAYQPWHAARADLLARLGHTDAARAAYDRAIRDAANANDAAFLARRRDRLP